MKYPIQHTISLHNPLKVYRSSNNLYVLRVVHFAAHFVHHIYCCANYHISGQFLEISECPDSAVAPVGNACPINGQNVPLLKTMQNHRVNYNMREATKMAFHYICHNLGQSRPIWKTQFPYQVSNIMKRKRTDWKWSKQPKKTEEKRKCILYFVESINPKDQRNSKWLLR